MRRKKLRKALAEKAAEYAKAWEISQRPGGDPLGEDRIIMAEARLMIAALGIMHHQKGVLEKAAAREAAKLSSKSVQQAGNA